MEHNYLIEKKTLWEKEKLLVMNDFFFSHTVFKSCPLLMHQNENLWSKGLIMIKSFAVNPKETTHFKLSV